MTYKNLLLLLKNLHNYLSSHKKLRPTNIGPLLLNYAHRDIGLTKYFHFILYFQNYGTRILKINI